MEWGITNRGKDAIRFQVALSPGVSLPDSSPKGQVILKQGYAVLAIEGLASVTNTATGKILVTDIGGTTARSLMLRASTNRDLSAEGLKR